MEIEQFDAFTQQLSGDGPSRRQALRALGAMFLGGAITGVAARLGLAEDATAKAKKPKAKAKPKRQSPAERKAQGQLQAEGKRKGKGKGKPGKRKPKPNPCGPNLKSCPDGSCVATSACCPGSKRCGSEGCIPANECCELTAPLCTECQEEFCDTVTGEWVCRDGCPAGFSCCNGLCEPPCDNGCVEDPSRACLCERPPDGMKYCAAEHVCVTVDECCPNDPTCCPSGSKRCFPGSSCIPNTQCCMTAPRPECDEFCERSTCENGEWVCQKITQGVDCGSGKCCPIENTDYKCYGGRCCHILSGICW